MSTDRTLQLSQAIGTSTAAKFRDLEARKFRETVAAGPLAIARHLELWAPTLEPPEYARPRAEAERRLTFVLWAIRKLEASSEPTDAAMAKRARLWLRRKWRITNAAALVASHPDWEANASELAYAWGEEQLPPAGGTIQSSHGAGDFHCDPMVVTAAVRRLSGGA